MKPLAMTEDNFNAVIRAADPTATDIKTETRRLVTISGHLVAKGWFSNAPFEQILTPRMKIGDRAYLKEPTQNIAGADYTNKKLHIQYFWGNPESRWVTPTEQDLIKINNRKTGIYSKQGAMFMLKSFARHSVEILDVRIERLLDITDEGAIAEGIKSRSLDGVTKYWDYLENRFAFDSPKRSYISEIEMLHTKEIAAANPWLWVYKFRYLTGDDNG